METALVVVESPAKAKTIKKYLGSGYEVRASVGHIKDLPAKELGVNIEAGFVPEYRIIEGKEKIVNELRAAAKKASKVLLATDPDREGEAIAWHLSEVLEKSPESVYRVLFNELTEKTIKQAVANPGRLDERKYNAQQARRILDRIVGYHLSPLLWQKVQYGLSAGRVQSVALRLIVDRQEEIEAFVPQEYWTITACLAAAIPPTFEAKLVEVDGKKCEISDVETAQRLADIARSHSYVVQDVKTRERVRKPSPPFITSTLQQEASRKLRFTGSRTMRIAQQLYEGIELGPEGSVGLITYMRTDSPRIAPEALAAVRSYIASAYGEQYLPPQPHYYKGGKAAQEAHEAIRPTSMVYTPERIGAYLDKDQKALYTLIWNRFVASQAAPAVFDLTTANIRCGTLLFRVTGSVMKFDGFLKIYGERREDEADSLEPEGDEDRTLPPLSSGDILELKALHPRQHFTQPPPAYNEASLIKELEDLGIGRPSTYAETVSTIQKRKYVEVISKRFRPTLLGRIIARLLVDSFPRLVNSGFTAEMESSLDLVEEGTASWIQTLDMFFKPFQSDLEEAKKKMRNVKRLGIPTRDMCPECGHPLLIRSGRYGLFYGCSGYPDCTYTANIESESNQTTEPVPTDELCPDCGAPMVIREGKTGKFLSCSRYPQCKASRPLSTGLPCPACGQGELIERRTKARRTFYSCSRYPNCSVSLWHKPVGAPCPNPQCGSPIMELQSSKRWGTFLQCPKCKTKENVSGESSQASSSVTPRKKRKNPKN